MADHPAVWASQNAQIKIEEDSDMGPSNAPSNEIPRLLRAREHYDRYPPQQEMRYGYPFSQPAHPLHAPSQDAWAGHTAQHLSFPPGPSGMESMDSTGFSHGTTGTEGEQKFGATMRAPGTRPIVCDDCRAQNVRCDGTEATSCSNCVRRNARCQFTKESNPRKSSVKQVRESQVKYPSYTNNSHFDYETDYGDDEDDEDDIPQRWNESARNPRAYDLYLNFDVNEHPSDNASSYEVRNHMAQVLMQVFSFAGKRTSEVVENWGRGSGLQLRAFCLEVYQALFGTHVGKVLYDFYHQGRFTPVVADKS